MPILDWRLYALGSAFFASLTAILGKVGVAGLPSNLATLVRTVVILLFALALVTARQEWRPLENKATLFLVLSGLATGASWLCYYRALQLGPASRVAPIDKLSVALTIVLAAVFLGESITWKTALGGVLVVAGSLVLAF
jgi:transporter family protein